MPTVPAPRQTVAPEPIAGVRVSVDAPIESFGGGAANTRIGLGGLAAQAAAIFEEEKKKADQTAVLKAASAASEAETRLRIAARQRVGEDAFKAPDDTAAEWGKVTSDIESTLSNDTQRAAFEGIKASHWRELDDSVQAHVADQRVKLNAQVTDAYLANERNAALDAVKDGNLPRVGLSIANQKAAVTDHLNQVFAGKIPEGVLDQALQTAESQTHTAVIQQMISAGADLAAKAYFTEHKAEIHGNDIAQAQKMVEISSTEGAGARAADAAWRELGPKALNDPVRIETIEQAIRDKLGDDQPVIKAAIQEVRSRAAAHNAEQAEVKAVNIAAVYGAMNEGASLRRLTSMPEYIALTGTEQATLKQNFLQQQYTASERSYQASQRAEAEKARAGFAKYWEYQDPKKLSTMSDAQVLALQPELGRELVNALMVQKRSVSKSEEAVRSATIDDDQFKTIANEAGLKPYDTGLSPEQKAGLGQLKNAVENEIARQQAEKGKVLTREEKQVIMTSLIDNKVMVDEWGRDPTLVAATLTPKQRAKAYVPLDQIRTREQAAMAKAGQQGPDFVDQAIAWIRDPANGVLRDIGSTDAEVLKLYKSEIEKAYAARRLGATTAEIQAILRGAP